MTIHAFIMCRLVTQICNRGKVHIFKYLSRVEQMGADNVSVSWYNHRSIIHRHMYDKVLIFSIVVYICISTDF